MKLNKTLHILIIEPFYAGSHKLWTDQLVQYSSHDIDLLTLKGKNWKWRMHGGAVTLAQKYLQLDKEPDLVIASDMLDLSTFIGLLKGKLKKTKIALYFHENQLTYPWSKDDADVKLQRDRNYAWINYTSALAADYVFFNSHYHKKSFIEALPIFLKAFPDHKNLSSIARIIEKSETLHLGLHLKPFIVSEQKSISTKPIILWNHRWEYDKNPEAFFNCLFNLSNKGLDFELIVLGESYKTSPPIFAEARVKLKKQIIHFGYVDNKLQYINLVKKSDILLVTSQQDYFGISIIEAIAAGVAPLLPNRLSYPEHIAVEDHGEYYYENSYEMQEKLSKWIQNWPNKLPSLSKEIIQYDWEHMIKIYDDIFHKLVVKEQKF